MMTSHLLKQSPDRAKPCVILVGGCAVTPVSYAWNYALGKSVQSMACGVSLMESLSE